MHQDQTPEAPTPASPKLYWEDLPMKSKPHVGLMHTRGDALNQHDEVVMKIERCWAMFDRRTPSEPPMPTAS